MTFERDSFIDIIRLSQSTGRVPAEIPAHYWRFCWRMRRHARGNISPAVDMGSLVRADKLIKLGYQP